MPPSVKSEFARNPISSIAAIIASLCAVATLITGVALAARWTESVEQMLAHNTESDNRHHSDPTLHMPYEVKVDKFVTRTEWVDRGIINNAQFNEIKASQVRTEQKLDKLIDKFIP